MSKIDTSKIEWKIESKDDDGDAVTLTAAPVPRVIPDGVRVRVAANAHSKDETRAIVRVVPTSKESREGFRFASTMSCSRAYAQTKTRTHPVYNGAGQVMRDRQAGQVGRHVPRRHGVRVRVRTGQRAERLAGRQGPRS